MLTGSGSHHQLPPTEKERSTIAFLKANIKGKLLDDDTAFPLFSDRLLLNFARVNNAEPQQALAQIEATIAWRRDYKPHRITLADVANYANLHLVVPLGRSKQGMPVVYFRPRSGVAIPAEDRLRFNIWLREELRRRGYVEFVFVLDFAAVSSSSSEDNKARDAVEAIRTRYYPLQESLTLVLNLPLLLRVAFNLVMKFMNEAQRKTMRTGLKANQLLEYIDVTQLHEAYGGALKAPPAEGKTIVDTLPPPQKAASKL